MPEAPPRYSPFKRLREAGLIKRTAAKERDERRGSARERGYGTRWDKTSLGFRERHPLCCCCMANGVVKAATVVDHVVPHRGDMALFWDRSNWQGLCTGCHNVIKRTLELRWDRGQVTAEELKMDRRLPEWFAPPPGG